MWPMIWVYGLVLWIDQGGFITGVTEYASPYQETFFYKMTHGDIPRTPILQPSQHWNDLIGQGAGYYPTTGGGIYLGSVGNGSVIKQIGIFVNNTPDWTVVQPEYDPANTTFNKNFASVLYEMKTAGQKSATLIKLDHYIHGSSKESAMYSQYLHSFKEYHGSLAEYTGNVPLDSNLITKLAESRS